MLTEDELAARKAAVSKIELMFTIGRNSKNSAVVNTLAAELHPKESPQPPDGTLVTAGIISADNATAYYLWFHIDKLETEVATLKHQVATLTEMLSKVVEHVAEKDRQERLAAASRSGLDQLIRQLESGASNIDLSDVALPPGLLSSLADD